MVAPHLCLAADPFPKTRLGFSPQAIFMSRGAPGTSMSWMVLPRFLTMAPSPPMASPDPGITWLVVTPCARIAGKAGSRGSMASTARSCAKGGFVISFTSSVQ